MKLLIFAFLLAFGQSLEHSFYKSESIPKLYPVKHFRLETSNLDTYSIGEPSSIRVQFLIAGVRFDEILPLIDDPGHLSESSGSDMSLNTSTVNFRRYGFIPETFHENLISLAVKSDGTVSGFVEIGKHFFEVRPTHTFRNLLAENDYDHASKRYKMLAHLRKDVSESKSITQSRANSVNPLWEDSQFPTEASRWVGCVKKNTRSIFTYKVGFIAENQYNNKAGSISAVIDDFKDILTLVNRIFVPQLGIRVTLGYSRVFTSPSNQRWNKQSCELLDSEILPEFSTYITEFVKSRPDLEHIAGFILGTNCFQRFAGVAFIGRICYPEYNVAAFSGTAAWMTVAHELGHLMGAGHSFESPDEQGKVGGIMDYGTKQLDGVYQFNEKRDKEICDYLNYQTDDSNLLYKSGCLVQEPSILGLFAKKHFKLNDPRSGKSKAKWKTEIPATSRLCFYDSSYTTLYYCKENRKLKTEHTIFFKLARGKTAFIKAYSTANSIESSAKLTYTAK